MADGSIRNHCSARQNHALVHHAGVVFNDFLLAHIPVIGQYASIDITECVTEEVRLMLNARALNDEAIVFLFHEPVELDAAHLAFLEIDFNGFPTVQFCKFRIGTFAV